MEPLCTGCGHGEDAHGAGFPCAGYDVLVEDPDTGNLVPALWDESRDAWAPDTDTEPTNAQLERLNNPDSGPSDSAYRAAMRDAGRGRLLSDNTEGVWPV